MKKLLEEIIVKFEYIKEGRSYKSSFAGNYTSDDFDVNLACVGKSEVDYLTLVVQPKVKLTLKSINLELKHRFEKNEMVFVNGYQSWTDSREFFLNDRMHSISKLAYPLMNKYQFDKYGDTNFKKTSKRSGDFHGYTYGYIRKDETFTLIGSLSEMNGFTIINTSVKDGTIRIEKDCDGLEIEQAYPVFELVFIDGDENFVFDQYFKAMNIQKTTAKPMTGWTSWYNYYQNINEEIILRNLDVLKQTNKKIGIFQVDDGYQTFVGDWLDIDLEKFPKGMQHIAQSIHKQGYKAGLWLAPFVCETNSRVFKEHKDWILKDKQGNLAIAGGNWSRFYALNLEHPEVKAYIKHVFDVVLNEWGYDLVKLDFLYAVCMVPSVTKTRGQIMCEAMDFLRECVGDKLILACGVPLVPSFGRVDYCRIGCDVGLDWDDKAYMRLFHRERVSTLNAIGNAIGRRQLNKRAFINDPDVFFFREDNIMLSQTQKETLAFVNRHFGDLLFTSDDVSKYKSAQHKDLDTTMADKDIEIIKVGPYVNGLIEVIYTSGFEKYRAQINLSGKEIMGIEAYATKVSHIVEVA